MPTKIKGIVINERYAIQDEIGKGSMGVVVVYRAKDKLLKRDVAV